MLVWCGVCWVGGGCLQGRRLHGRSLLTFTSAHHPRHSPLSSSPNSGVTPESCFVTGDFNKRNIHTHSHHACPELPLQIRIHITRLYHNPNVPSPECARAVLLNLAAFRRQLADASLHFISALAPLPPAQGCYSLTNGACGVRASSRRWDRIIRRARAVLAVKRRCGGWGSGRWCGRRRRRSGGGRGRRERGGRGRRIEVKGGLELIDQVSELCDVLSRCCGPI